MNKNRHKAKPDKKTRTENKSHNQAPKRWKVFKDKIHTIASTWFEYFLVGIIFLLFGPVTGVLIDSLKFVYLSAAIALSLIVWITVFRTIKHAGVSKKDSISIGTGITFLIIIAAWIMISRIPPSEPEFHGFLIPANEPTPEHACKEAPFVKLVSDCDILIYGNNAAYVCEYPQNILRVSGQDLLSINKAFGLISIILTIRSPDNRVVAQIIDNEFYINRNNFLRTNRPDKHTLEVYDQEGTRVLYLKYLNHSTMKILGVFQVPRKKPVIIAEDVTTYEGRKFSHNCAGRTRGSVINIE